MYLLCGVGMFPMVIHHPISEEYSRINCSPSASDSELANVKAEKKEECSHHVCALPSKERLNVLDSCTKT